MGFWLSLECSSFWQLAPHAPGQECSPEQPNSISVALTTNDLHAAKQKLRELATHAGWIRVTRDGWICPLCKGTEGTVP